MVGDQERIAPPLNIGKTADIDAVEAPRCIEASPLPVEYLGRRCSEDPPRADASEHHRQIRHRRLAV
jgi:hypothetical protein